MEIASFEKEKARKGTQSSGTTGRGLSYARSTGYDLQAPGGAGTPY